MPKLIDLLKVVSNQINNNEVSAALGASEPFAVDISEDEFNAASTQIKGMMTLESAVNNVEVANAIKPKVKTEIEGDLKRELKSSMYGNLETKIEGLGDKLGIDLKGKRLDDQIDSLSKISIGSGSNKEYEALQSEFSTFKEQAVKEVQEYKDNLSDFKINTTLQTKMSSIPLAKPYQDERVKSSLYNDVINEVRSKAVVKVDDRGQVTLFNPENPEMKLFGENNKELGINDLIDPLMQPYIQATPEPFDEKHTKEIKVNQLPNTDGSAGARVKDANRYGNFKY
jgi:hypothetical protein